MDNPRFIDGQTLILTGDVPVDTIIGTNLGIFTQNTLTVQTNDGTGRIVAASPKGTVGVWKPALSFRGDGVKIRVPVIGQPTDRLEPVRYDYPANMLILSLEGAAPVDASGVLAGVDVTDLLAATAFSAGGDGGWTMREVYGRNFGYRTADGVRDGEWTYVHTSGATASPARGIKACLLVGGGAGGIIAQVYSGSGQNIDAVTFEDVIYDERVGAEFFARNPGTIYNLTLTRVTSWGSTFSFGLPDADTNTNLTLASCVLVVDGAGTVIRANTWTGLDIQNNTVISLGGGVLLDLLTLTGTNTVDFNTYYSSLAKPFKLDGASYTFAEWQALGFDANSTFLGAAPTGFAQSVILLTLNNRVAFIAACNWDSATSLDIDVTALSLATGNYRLRNGRNPDNAGTTATNNIVDFAYTLGDNVVTVHFDNRSSLLPTGDDEHYMSADDVRWGNWILEVVP